MKRLPMRYLEPNDELHVVEYRVADRGNGFETINFRRSWFCWEALS